MVIRLLRYKLQRKSFYNIGTWFPATPDEPQVRLKSELSKLERFPLSIFWPRLKFLGWAKITHYEMQIC